MNYKLKLIPILLVVLAIGCSSKKSESEDKGLQAHQDITDLYMFETEKADSKWTLVSESAQIVGNSEKAYLRNPIVNLKENRKTTAKIKSKEGEVDLTTKIITLKRNVSANSFKENVFITTDLLYYSYDTNRIWSDSKVTVKQDGVTIKGKGFEANSDLSEVVIKQQETDLGHSKNENS
jgi:LPS export ABC transporter protein LptC